MKYSIRLSQKEDMSQVHALIQELVDFEKESQEVELTTEDVMHDGFSEKNLFKCFVAEFEGEIVGMALVYPRYSTWKGPAIHLEDLIVTKKMRGVGIGSALMNQVIEYSADLGVKRVCWEVLDWNEPAIKFYESKGAKVMRDWDVVQLNEKGIQNYLNKL